MFQEKGCLNSIFIDLDGPILDVSERYYLVYRNIIKKLGGKPLDKNSYWKLKKNNMPLEEILGLSELRTMESVFKNLWLDLIEKKSFLIYDKVLLSVKKTLSLLKRRNRLILVTLRSSPLNLKWQLNKLNLREFFDLVLFQGNNRSNWQVKYRLIKNSKELNSHSCIIGDTEIDIFAGKKLGIKTIAVLSGIRNRDFLYKCKPDHIFNFLKDVVGILSD